MSVAYARRANVCNLTPDRALPGRKGPTIAFHWESAAPGQSRFMISVRTPARRTASRRGVLGLAAGALALGGVSAAGLAAATAAKATHKSVDYQSHPKGGKGCNTCNVFQPPSKCKTVESPVEAGGWCSQYKKS
jgi:hypothetical protein